MFPCDDEPQRVLFWHDESDCLFEVFDPTLIAQLRNDLEVEDVTGVPSFELKFSSQSVASATKPERVRK